MSYQYICFLSQIPLSEKIKEYHQIGYIDDLIDVHFADAECYKQRITSEESRLEVLHHAGLFVMLSVGIILGIMLVFVEHFVYRYLVPKFRRKSSKSCVKSSHLMFFSQVRREKYYLHLASFVHRHTYYTVIEWV